MESKRFYFLNIFYVISLSVVLSAQKFDQISDCIFYDRSVTTGIDNVTFICAKDSNENGVFIDQMKFHCSNSVRNVYNYYPGTIDFRNCRFAKLKRNFFKQFPRMHTFIMSNLEMESLDMTIFSEATNVTKLIASHNLLTDLPPLFFSRATKLTFADFSNNSIQQINHLAFISATKLEVLDLSQNVITSFAEDLFIDLPMLNKLNLSYNQIKKLESLTLSIHNLVTLDLSNNDLTKLNDHAFDQLILLKHLNLSDNSIVDLKIGMFAYLPNLEDLNLRRTNISSIQFGTFSHQHKLVSLDLSENNLQILDFNLFLPAMHDLRSLELDGNQLKHLEGFGNGLFPKLTLLDIKNNKFNCSYLILFMKSVNWEKIRLPIDPTSIDPSAVSVRGIKCEQTGIKSQSDNFQKSNQGESNAKTYENTLLPVFVIFMVLFAILAFNKDRIQRQFRRSPTSRLLERELSTIVLNIDCASVE